MSKTKRTRAPAKKTASGAETTPVVPAAGPATAEAIALRAYALWRESGCAHGNDQAHWFHAERELRAGAGR